MTMFITVCVIIVIGIVVAVVMDRIMRTHDTLHEACSRTRRGERGMIKTFIVLALIEVALIGVFVAFVPTF